MTDGKNEAPVAPEMTPEEEARAGGMKMTGGMTSPFNLVPKNLTEAMELAKLLAKCELVPKDYLGKPGNILLAVQKGMSLGLSPDVAIESIAVINGRATLWGDAVLGLIRASGTLDNTFASGGIEERPPAECWEKKEGRCAIKRKGFAEPLVRTFSYEEAERAGLIERAKGGRGNGPWITYPGRMLQMRARSWALRDACPDILKGLKIAEEQRDVMDAEYVVREPTRVSDAPPIEAGAVDSFVAQTGPAGSPQRTGGGGGSSGGGSAPSTPPQKGNVWKGKIAQIESPKSGSTNGNKWTLYPIVGSDGTRFGAFKSDHAEVAQSLKASGEMAEIEYTVKNGRNGIDSIAPA